MLARGVRNVVYLLMIIILLLLYLGGGGVYLKKEKKRSRGEEKALGWGCVEGEGGAAVTGRAFYGSRRVLLVEAECPSVRPFLPFL